MIISFFFFFCFLVFFLPPSLFINLYCRFDFFIAQVSFLEYDEVQRGRGSEQITFWSSLQTHGESFTMHVFLRSHKKNLPNTVICWALLGKIVFSLCAYFYNSTFFTGKYNLVQVTCQKKQLLLTQDRKHEWRSNEGTAKAGRTKKTWSAVGETKYLKYSSLWEVWYHHKEVS